MQTRKHDSAVINGILRGERPPRLVALIDGAAEREAAQRAAYESWTPPEIPNPWARRPRLPAPEVYVTRYGYSGRRRTAAYRRMWSTLSPSQRALAASKHAQEKPGGAWRWRHDTIDDLAGEYDCSRRLVLMAKKLWATGSRRLLRAVAAGTVGLADALAHAHLGGDELRHALELVRSRRARSLRQAVKAGRAAVLSTPDTARGSGG